MHKDKDQWQQENAELLRSLVASKTNSTIAAHCRSGIISGKRQFVESFMDPSQRMQWKALSSTPFEGWEITV